MKSARLIITMFAGVVCNPRPARRNESATTNRVKLVTMMRRPGASDNTVSSATSWMMRPLALPPPGGRSEERSGIWAAAAVGQKGNEQDKEDAFHWTTRVSMISSCTLPRERTAARSLRSSRRYCRPRAPSICAGETVLR